MKKVVKIVSIVFVGAVVVYFSYGLYLNLTLKEKIVGANKDFLIIIRETSNMYPFEYVKFWENGHKIGSLFEPEPHPFFVVNNMFFNKKLSICLDNNTRPFTLKKKNYMTSWFYMSGIKYVVDLREEDRIAWREAIISMTVTGSYPKTAKLVESEKCDTSGLNNTIKEYSVRVVDAQQRVSR